MKLGTLLLSTGLMVFANAMFSSPCNGQGPDLSPPVSLPTRLPSQPLNSQQRVRNPQKDLLRSCQLVERKIQKSIEAYSRVKGEKEKKQAKADLSKLLITYFDTDMKIREEQLTKIKQRFTKLRDHLDSRRKKKDQLIALQMNLCLNQANGFGFFNSKTNSRTSYPHDRSYFSPPAPGESVHGRFDWEPVSNIFENDSDPESNKDPFGAPAG